MAKKTLSDAEALSPQLSAGVTAELLSVRQNYLLFQIAQPKLGSAATALSNRGITHWEQLGCVGYIPESSLLEATITIKQANGYSGGLCSTGSAEYVRFFVDWGAGWEDAGVSSVQVHDISDAPPGAQHPLQYLVRHPLDTTGRRRYCGTPVLPKVRAVLSWNVEPSLDPNELPVFGNRVDTRLQIRKKELFLLADLLDASVLQSSAVLQAVDLDTPIPLKKLPPGPPPGDVQESAAPASEADSMRSVYALTRGAVAKPNVKRALAQPKPEPAPEAALLPGLLDFNVDFLDIVKYFDSNKANVDYEQLRCVALNPQIDTLGAIVRIKKSAGYSGNLCSDGSREYVAFWADWNNNGTFDEYLGTASVDVYDIIRPGDDPIDYAVQLPTTKFFSRLKKCNQPQVIGIRAVLSWQTPPSITDPNDLQTYGNRVDVRVQLRPAGAAPVNGVVYKWYEIGSVPIEQISTTSHLAINGDRPWGGIINVTGRISTDVPMATYYSVEWKKAGAPAGDYLPVTTSQVFNLEKAGLPMWSVTHAAIAGRWFENVERPLEFPPTFERNAMLAQWYAGGMEDGQYDLRLSVTADNPAMVANPALVGQQTIRIEVCNTGFNVNPGFGSAVNPAYSLDIVIDGGDCKQYKKSATPPIIVNGHLRVKHKFYGGYSLSLEPSAHNHGAVLAPTPDSYDFAGDQGHDNRAWSLDSVADLDPCGYVVMIHAYDRTILNSNGASRHTAHKAVGLSVTP